LPSSYLRDDLAARDIHLPTRSEVNCTDESRRQLLLGRHCHEEALTLGGWASSAPRESHHVHIINFYRQWQCPFRTILNGDEVGVATAVEIVVSVEPHDEILLGQLIELDTYARAALPWPATVTAWSLPRPPVRRS